MPDVQDTAALILQILSNRIATIQQPDSAKKAVLTILDPCSLSFAGSLSNCWTDKKIEQSQCRSTHGSDPCHIAFYIGMLSNKDSTAFFHVISKDTGFDPLIAHLKALKISVLRSKAISDIPLLKAANSQSMPEKIALIVSNLKQRGTSKPRSTKTLSSTISSLFQKQLSDNELTSILSELERRGLVSVSGTRVSYVLPEGES
jgi:hypothetical protein